MCVCKDHAHVQGHMSSTWTSTSAKEFQKGFELPRASGGTKTKVLSSIQTSSFLCIPNLAAFSGFISILSPFVWELRERFGDC